MEIGIQTPLEHTDYSRIRDIWQAADELGYDAGFTFDHFVPLTLGSPPQIEGGIPKGPQLEGWTTLAALGAVTRRLKIGTLVSGVTYRHPILLAKMAVTLDHITDGRALFGLGAAWHKPEHTMYGFDFPAIGDRMTMLDETVETFKLLCTAEDPVDYHGRFVHLEKACFDPKPMNTRGIPVLIGGAGKRLRRITARHADWYNGFWAPWEWVEVNAGLDSLLEHYGRRSSDLKRTVLALTDLSGDIEASDSLVKKVQATRKCTIEQARAQVVAGSPEQMISVLVSYNAAGVDMVILKINPDQGIAELESFARCVKPRLDSSSEKL